jgi:hypothetical protein
MAYSFFIDESGHSGDAVNSGTAFDFLDQPYFVLAAVGVEDEALLVRQLERLKVAHRIPAGELKSKLLQRRPAFVEELLSFVCDQRLPFFVEVVDKRYFICSHLVISQLLPAEMGLSEGPELYVIRNQVVDFLYDEVSDHVLNTFVAACLEPSDHALMTAFESQLLFAAGRSSTSAAQDIRDGMHFMAVEAIKAYKEIRKGEPDAYLRFLPLPDLNKHGKQVWMLPNLSSFTNIYARINLFLRGKLSRVRLVHDHQKQLDQILRDAKRAAESIRDAGVKPFTPHSDYTFFESASLEFAASHESAGIQIADIIAGTVMRFYRDRLRGVDSKLDEAIPALTRLFRASDASTGIGVNQVVPMRFALSYEGP